MKHIISLLLIAFILTSCNKEGDITDQSGAAYSINGKPYQFVKIVPSNG